MNLIELEIEKRALQEVIVQFTIHDCDARMCTKLDSFLKYIENRIDIIQQKLLT